MSSSNIFRIPLTLANIDVFTFGESSLYGYDSLNHCLIVYSLNDLNNLTSSPIHLHLSSSPPSSIKKLILNPNQTILALISDKTAHFVYLPQLNNSPSKNTRLCLLNILSPLDSNSSQLTNTLIDFLWLSPNHFVIVNSCPSSNECHLYRICPSKHSIIEYLQTFSVGLSFRGQIRKSGTPNKSISLQQPENIIKLDLAKRKQDQLILILLFALKDNGDMFLLEIDENQLINNENYLYGEFIGPLRILPSTYNNYGSNYRHSKFLCLSCSENALVVFTPNLNELNQCILLNPSNETYCLYTIDSINLPKTSEKISLIKSMIKNPLNSNIYYISDSLSNVYSIEISWINQIDQKSNEIRSTNIQYLCKSDHSIEQIALIQRNNKGQWLAILTNTSQNQQKELILLRPNSSSISSTNITESHSSFEPIKTNQSNLPSEFLERIHSILRHDQTLPL
ncbi:hypothetical protein I4U23_017377 [Adineta vaga]|nr:hypothetical protein I4U23_017377 [Adineta vaga]